MLRAPKVGPSRLGNQRKGSSITPFEASPRKERYNAMNTGICTKAGRHPARGFT